jgi:hypothetical protein
MEPAGGVLGCLKAALMQTACGEANGGDDVPVRFGRTFYTTSRWTPA